MIMIIDSFWVCLLDPWLVKVSCLRADFCKNQAGWWSDHLKSTFRHFVKNVKKTCTNFLSESHWFPRSWFWKFWSRVFKVQSLYEVDIWNIIYWGSHHLPMGIFHVPGYFLGLDFIHDKKKEIDPWRN